MTTPTWDDTEEVIEVPRFEDTSEDIPVFEDTTEIATKPEDIEDDSISGLEASLLGLGEGATFGLSDIAAGIGAAGMEAGQDIGDILGLTEDTQLKEKGFKLEDDYKGLKGLVDAYYAGRDKSASLKKQAAEEHPFKYYGSSILGGASSGATGAKLLPQLKSILPSLTGPAKGASAVSKLKFAGKEGIKAGALAGFGGGDARLLEGEIPEAIKETTAGAALGGATGLGVGALGEGIKTLGKGVTSSRIFEPIKAGYKWGKEGLDLDEKVVQAQTQKLAKKIERKMAGKLKKLGLQKKDIRDLADEMGVRVNAGEDIRSIQVEILDRLESGFKTAKTGASQSQKALQEMSDIIDEWTGEAIPDIRKKVARKLQDIRSKQAGLEKQARLKMEKKAAQKALKRGEQSEIVEDIVEAGDESLIGADPRIKTKGIDVDTERTIMTKDELTGDIAPEDITIRERYVSDITPVQPRVDYRRKGNELIARISDRVSGKELGKFRQIINNATDIENMTFGEAESLLTEINKYSGVESELINDKEVIGLMKQLGQRVRNNINKAIEKSGGNLPNKNKKMRDVLLAKRELGLKGFDPNIDKDAEIAKIQKKLTATGGASQVDKELIFRRLKRAGIDRGGKLKERSEFLDDVRRITGDTSTDTKITRANFVTQGAAGGANVVGKGVKMTGRGLENVQKYVKNNYQSLLDASPETIQRMAQQLKSKGGAAVNFATQLMKAATKDNRLRTAVLFGLYQQPAFRETLRKLEWEDNELK